MRNAYAVGRVQLKSKLLIGVAGLVAAGSASAAAADATAPAAQAPKWLPYADVGAGIGDGFVQGKVDLFIPVWQDIDSLFFGRIGLGTQTHNDEILNVGIGYRTKVDPEWILGLYAGIDNTHTDFGHNFSRYSLGAEMMSADWDVRLNGYQAKHDPRPIASGLSNQYELYIHDTQIGILQAQEAAYSGFDGEVGYRVFHTDTTDVRLFAGGFVFHNNYHAPMFDGQDFGFKYPTMSGPRGRAEVNMFDLDILGEQSRLSFDGEITHDKVRGTSGFAGATLRIPLGASSGQGAQTLDDLDRRMADPVRRQDNVLTQWQFNKPEPVIIYNGTITSEPTNTLYYVDNHSGHGSYADPTTLKDATDRGPVNQFVVLTDRDGPVDSTGVEVQYGETVVGPGVFSIRGVDSGQVFTHDFAPGSGPVSITSSDPNVITLDANTNLFGITIDAPFVNAIYGHNINDVVIGNVTIDGGGTGTNGILIKQDAGGPADISIYDTTIEGVTHDGVEVDITNDTGGASSFDLYLTNVTADAGHDGVSVSSVTSGSSSSTVYAGVHDSNISGGASDVIMTGTVYAGSSLTQTLVVDPTVLSGGDYGIFVDGYAHGGTLNQTVNVSDVTTSDNAVAGIYIAARGTDGATVTQHVTLTNVTVHGTVAPHYEYYGEGSGYSSTYTGSSGVVIVAKADDESTVTQTAALTNVTVDDAFYGVQIGAFADNDSTVHQTVTLDGITVHGVQYTNTYYDGEDTYTSTVGTYGIRIGAYSYDGSTVTQDATLSNIYVDSGVSGIQIGAIAGDATTHQTFSITHAIVSGAYYDNIDIISVASYGATVHQYGTLDDVSATDALTGDGLHVVDAAQGGATAIQRLGITGLTASYNYASGVDICALAVSGGVAPAASVGEGLSCFYGSGPRATAEPFKYIGEFGDTPAIAAQYVSIDDATIVYNGYSGALALVGALGYASARQDVSITNSTMDYNGAVGFGAVAAGVLYGTAEQNIYLGYDDISHNHYRGAVFAAYAVGLGSAQQNVDVYEATVNNNGGDGIAISGYAKYAGQVLQNVGLYYVDATGNLYDGLDVSTNAYGYATGPAYAYYSHVGQNIVAAYDTFSNNARNGVEINNYAGYGAQVDQFVYLFHDTLNANGLSEGLVPLVNPASSGSGVYEYSKAEAFGYDGGAIQTNIYADLYVVDSEASGNAQDGITVKGDANGPTYLIQHIDVLNTDADDNGRTGFVAYASASDVYSFNQQYIVLADSHFDYNDLDGAAFLVSQHYGPLSFGAAVQSVTVQDSTFSYNTRDGLYADADAYDLQGRAEQHFAITGSTFDYNGRDGIHVENYAHDGVLQPATDPETYYTCDTVQGVYGGCAFVRQTIDIGYSDISHNTGDGIYIGSHADNYGAIYNSSGRPYETPTLYVGYSTVSNNGGDGLHIENNATNNSYIYSYALLVDSHFDHNGGDGIEVNSSADGNSKILQGTILYATTEFTAAAFDSELPSVYASSADDNTGDGVHVYSSASLGSTIGQLVGVYGSDVSGNGGAGVYVHSYAKDVSGSAYPSVVAQYVNIYGSAIDGNTGDGVDLGTQAIGFNAITKQDAEIYYSTLSGNAVGVNATAAASSAASTGQYLYFGGDTIGDNSGDGVYANAASSGQGFAKQIVSFSYYALGSTDISGNGGDGISVNVSAYTGATAYSGVFAYHVGSSHNEGDGLAIGTNANGYGFGSSYIYYSHISQNTISADATFDYNGQNGAALNNTATYGGVLDQLAYFVDMSASHNTGAGFYEKSSLGSTRGNSFSFSTNINSDVYLVDSTFDSNGANGVDMRSYINGPNYHPAFFGGYSYLIQHVQIAGIDASNNTGSGMVVNANQSGRYGLNAQYFTVDASTFDTNGIDGAQFQANSVYGPGGFGNVAEDITITGSDFSYNVAGSGLDLSLDASGNQGRAAQYVTATDSTFSYNGAQGVYLDRQVHDGVYVTGHPCASVQGSTGGCAIGRQTVGIYYSDMSHNVDDGVYVNTHATNYGTVYAKSAHGAAPTIYLAGDTADYNGGDGLHAYTHLDRHAYGYQYVLVLDSSLDYNDGSGVHVSSYVNNGASLKNQVTLYSYDSVTSTSHNDQDGVLVGTKVASGVYGAGEATSTVKLYGYDGQGIDANHNTGNGILLSDVVGAGAVGSYTHTALTVADSQANHNYGGIVLFANGQGAVQTATISNTYASNNTAGLAGVVLHDGSQTIHVTNGSFSHNSQDGIYLLAVASGSHTYVDQYLTVSGAMIDYNGGNGIHINDSATNGTYVAGNPCTVAQGGTGGCAVVRQTVSVTGSDISHNTSNGVFLDTYANNHGAIYSAHNRPQVPTLYIYGTTIDNNGARGVNISNHVSNSSYLYEYADIINTSIDHNSGDGVYAASYVGGASTMLQRAVLYAYDGGAASASYNAGNGFKSSIEALGGSYASDANVITGVDLSHNGSFGFDAAVAYADGTSTGLQTNSVYSSTINHNGDGIGLYSIGSGAQQMSYIGDNTVTYNSFVGVYGEANFGAFMYIGVYTFGNTVNHNGTNYLFNHFGGSTQVLN